LGTRIHTNLSGLGLGGIKLGTGIHTNLLDLGSGKAKIVPSTLDCPYTCVPKKEYFETLELVEGADVHLGKGKACQVQGFTMFDNREFLLHDIRNVHKLM
jgi:hypothetical protein